MKEFICKKDYYIEDVKFASIGDHVLLMPDNCTVVNTNGGQRVVPMPEIMKDNEYFTKTFETQFVDYSTVPETKKEYLDNVNHPAYYNSHPSGIECIEVIRHYCFDIGNAIKYLWRAGLKQDADKTSKEKEIEDLNKAIWYIKDRIKFLKKHG